MKAALFGGTGFVVGSYLVDELLERGHVPVLIVRPGSEDKLHRREVCETVSGVIEDPEAVRRTVTGADEVIYNIGILKKKVLGESLQRQVEAEHLRYLSKPSAIQAGVR